MYQHQYTPPYDRTALDGIIDDIKANWRSGFNTEQEAFARDISQKLIGLQGPPGTGKTYTVAPAAVARALSYAGDEPFTGQVSAHAHDAVDEVLDDANDVLEVLDTAGCLLRPVRLFRIYPSGIPAGSEEIQGQFIEHYSYNYDRDTLVGEFEAHFEDAESHPILVFGPPVTIRGLIDKLVMDGVIDGDRIDQLIQGARLTSTSSSTRWSTRRR
ncbi:hypothetical protein [Haladaptatus sp. DJG-WS-42]|uniref:hypothetical protein n=1 Tax=Haladaptatus sp. DJG-WS-42 TaxID=3120516 RepID=UPI0030CF1654